MDALRIDYYISGMNGNYEVVVGCGFLGPESYSKTCLYTTPPDQNLVGLIGRILSELALEGGSSFPIEAFRLERPAVSDAAFERTLHA